MMAELEKLEVNLGGVAEMKSVPDAVFVVDLRKEFGRDPDVDEVYDEVMARMETYLGEFEQHGTDNITVDMDE